MTTATVPLSALLPSKENPRRSYDQKSIEGLASTIETDGIIHNLTVRPEKAGKYRVVAGMRRYLALHHLLKKGAIKRSYRVPIKIRKGATSKQLIRLATVENVQREALDPIDEAEAFAKLLQGGAKIEDLAAETGVSVPTVRRRLALSDLSKKVKAAVRAKKVPISVAEALTLASLAEQKAWLKRIRPGSGIDAGYLRSVLLTEKPSAAIAIFPIEKYTGGLTKDLFADKETTYFDDREEFMRLQIEAVEELAQEYRQSFAWVEVVTDHVVPWWQYREAKKREPCGVIIHFQPTGRVELRKGLVRREVDPKAVKATKKADRPKEKSEWSVPTVRYANAHKSIVVQATLLAHPRKAKEVTAVLLLTSGQSGAGVALTRHACLRVLSDEHATSRAHQAINEIAGKLLKALGIEGDNGGERELPLVRLLYSGKDRDELYPKVQSLSNSELDLLIALCVVTCFGTASLDRLETEPTLLSTLGSDLKIDLRTFWTPDGTFLKGLRRDQLVLVAKEAGAVRVLPRLLAMSKKQLVEGLTRYFEQNASSTAELGEDGRQGRKWLPGCMRFVPAGMNE